MSAHLNVQLWVGAFLHANGRIHYKKGELRKAAELLIEAAKISHNATVFDHLATVLWKLGRADEALQYWREATLLSPGVGQTVKPGSA